MTVENPLEKFVASLTQSSFDSTKPTPLPLKFKCIQDHINLLAVEATLPAFNHPQLRNLCKRDPADIKLYGFLSGNTLDANFLKSLSVAQVSNYFDIPTHTDESHPSHPAITIAKPSVLRPLLDSITEILIETGNLLCDEKSLGDWIYNRKDLAALDLVRELGMTFPVFEDGVKAQRLVADLYMMFGHEELESGMSRGIELLPGSADEEVIAGLKSLCILQDDDGRDQAISACAEILASLEGMNLCAVKLDAYLRGLKNDLS